MKMIIALILLSVSATLALDCTDKYPCSQYYVTSYCTSSVHADWMKKNCNKFCGYCTTGGSGGQGTCGVVKVAKSRVVGGADATPGAWPWQVKIHYNGQFHCGGSLVNERWLVTAAHCVKSRSARNFRIYLGDHNRNKAENEQMFEVSTIIAHPLFHKYYKANNDIALMKLDRPAKYTDRVQPICLPAQGEKPAVGSKCYITDNISIWDHKIVTSDCQVTSHSFDSGQRKDGERWGKMKSGGYAARILQELKLTVQSNADCNRKNSFIFPITNKMICGANPTVTPNQSGCQGDSGGPFVCQKSDKSWTLQGAVSWGSARCDAKHAYSVFARVGEFRNWIDQYINN